MLNTTAIPAVFLTPPPPLQHALSLSSSTSTSLWPFPLPSLFRPTFNPTFNPTRCCGEASHVLLLRVLLILVLLSTFTSATILLTCTANRVSGFSLSQWRSSTGTPLHRTLRTSPNPISLHLEPSSGLERVRPGLLGGGGGGGSTGNGKGNSKGSSKDTATYAGEGETGLGETGVRGAKKGGGTQGARGLEELRNGPDVKDSCVVM